MDVMLSYGLTILALIIAFSAQAYVNSSYSKYKKVLNGKRLSGAAAARRMLDAKGMNDVRVNMVKGILSDHYDPRTKTVNLSRDIYNGETVAAVSVACHECGHALQDKEGYVFMRIRASLVPLVNLSSKVGYFAIMIGFIFGALKLVWIGIFAEVAILIFQLITLPVEFDASRKALQEEEIMGLLSADEMRGSKKMLRAAALTYVASVTSTLMEILRLVLIASSRNKD